MLHLLYILAFTILSFIAVGNLIRNLFTFMDQERNYPNSRPSSNRANYPYLSSPLDQVPHPELLDGSGNLIKDPLLVMRSINVEDARAQLDALYDASPNYKGDLEEG